MEGWQLATPSRTAGAYGRLLYKRLVGYFVAATRHGARFELQELLTRSLRKIGAERGERWKLGFIARLKKDAGALLVIERERVGRSFVLYVTSPALHSPAPISAQSVSTLQAMHSATSIPSALPLPVLSSAPAGCVEKFTMESHSIARVSPCKVPTLKAAPKGDKLKHRPQAAGNSSSLSPLSPAGQRKLGRAAYAVVFHDLLPVHFGGGASIDRREFAALTGEDLRTQLAVKVRPSIGHAFNFAFAAMRRGYSATQIVRAYVEGVDHANTQAGYAARSTANPYEASCAVVAGWKALLAVAPGYWREMREHPDAAIRAKAAKWSADRADAA